jgi:adenylate kinase
MIIVMGLPGAGKSTVLQVAKEAGWTVVNYGDMMMEIANEKYGVTDRDQLRKLPDIKQKTVQELVASKLAQGGHEKFILDTHCSINTQGGYLPGLPFAYLPQWHVKRLVLVTAPVKDILGRRGKDRTRVRDDQTADGLVEHEQINRSYLAAYSVLTGAPAAIIHNEDGKLQETHQKFKALLQ